MSSLPPNGLVFSNNLGDLSVNLSGEDVVGTAILFSNELFRLALVYY